MNQSLLFTPSANPISPVLEMGAYEALWDEPGASFKKIAERFRDAPGSMPSDFVDQARAKHYAELTLDITKACDISYPGIRLHGAAEYPQKLQDAKHPIALIYFRGHWELTETRSVAVVGSRQPSAEGIRRAQKLAKLLVERDFTVASGLAAGIDTAAHIAALKSDGRTFAVLGTPLSRCYPKSNAPLQQYLFDAQLVVSQVPFVRYSKQSPKINRFFFPERNKVMSALTEATVIVEAGKTSGTLVQARAALEQGRKLFIMDSCFEREDIKWPAKFLGKGAIRLSDFDQLIDELG